MCSVLEQAVEIRAQALSLFAQLLVSEGGAAQVTPALEACQLEEEEEGTRNHRKEVIASLHCSLALAEIHLSQSKVNS